MFPTTIKKAGEPERSALARKPCSSAAGWGHPGPHVRAQHCPTWEVSRLWAALAWVST